MKNFLKDPYGNMIAFGFVITFIAYILINAYTFIRYDAFVPLISLPILFIATVPAGLTFVAIEQYYKKKTIKSIEKNIDQLDEPKKSQLIELLKIYKNK